MPRTSIRRSARWSCRGHLAASDRARHCNDARCADRNGEIAPSRSLVAYCVSELCCLSHSMHAYAATGLPVVGKYDRDPRCCLKAIDSSLASSVGGIRERDAGRIPEAVATIFNRSLSTKVKSALLIGVSLNRNPELLVGFAKIKARTPPRRRFHRTRRSRHRRFLGPPRLEHDVIVEPNYGANSYRFAIARQRSRRVAGRPTPKLDKGSHEIGNRVPSIRHHPRRRGKDVLLRSIRHAEPLRTNVGACNLAVHECSTPLPLRPLLHDHGWRASLRLRARAAAS